MTTKFAVRVDALTGALGHCFSNRNALPQRHNGQRKGQPQQLSGLRPADGWPLKMRPRRGHLANGAQRGQLGQTRQAPRNGRGQHQPDQHVGQLAVGTAQAPCQQRRSHRNASNQQGHRLGRVELIQHMAQHAQGAVLGRRAQAQQIGQRVHGNQQRRPRREAKQHRRRNEIGQHTQAQPTNQPLHDAHHDRDRQRQLNVGRAESCSQRRQHGKQRQRVGVGRPRHDMPAGAKQRGNNAGHHGGVQPVLWRQTRQRGKGDALRQHQHRAQQASQCIRAQRARVNALHPIAQHAAQ